jgi:hypothetical protein
MIVICHWYLLHLSVEVVHVHYEGLGGVEALASSNREGIVPDHLPDDVVGVGDVRSDETRSVHPWIKAIKEFCMLCAMK